MQSSTDVSGSSGQHLGDLTGGGQRGGETRQRRFALSCHQLRGDVTRGADEQPRLAVPVGQARGAAGDPDGVPVAVADGHGVPAAAVPQVVGEGLVHQHPGLGIGLDVGHPRMRPPDGKVALVVADQSEEGLIGLHHGALGVGDEESLLEGLDHGAPEM